MILTKIRIAKELADLNLFPHKSYKKSYEKALKVVDALLEAIVKGVKRDGKCRMTNFGTFYAKKHPSRIRSAALVMPSSASEKPIGRGWYTTNPRVSLGFRRSIALHKELSGDQYE